MPRPRHGLFGGLLTLAAATALCFTGVSSPAAAAGAVLSVNGAALQGSVQPAASVVIEVRADRNIESLSYVVGGREVASAPVVSASSGSLGSAPVALAAYAGSSVTLEARLLRNGKVREAVTSTFSVRGGSTPVPVSTPTAVPTPSPTPTPPVSTPTATPTPSVAANRVTVCGTSLCLNGERWALRTASIYGWLDNAPEAVALARAGRLNTIRITDFLEGSSAASAVADERWWVRVDKIVATAQQAGLHVLLDLSTYRNLLVRDGVNPYTQDWGPLLRSVALRVNTVSGVRYADDPTIAMLSLAGEADPVNGTRTAVTPTTAQLTAFYSRSLGQWAAAAPSTLANTGGFLQLDWQSGIDWRAIMALPSNAVCSLHVYSDADFSTSLPAVADYCRSLGKPWIAEEFGRHTDVGDATRAAYFRKLLTAFAARGGAGFGFWNLGRATPGTFNVDQSTPLTWAVVRDAVL